MLSRDKLIYWGTVALIGFFFLEFFVPLLYVPSSQPSPSPGTPNPTDASGVFQGTGIALAHVKQLESQAFVVCPGFDSFAQNSSLVKGVITLQSGTAFSVELIENTSSESFAGFLALHCGSSTFLRKAFVELNSSVIVKDAKGKSEVITRESGLNYARTVGLPGLPAFIFGNVSAGSDINLTVSLSTENGRVLDFRLTQD